MKGALYILLFTAIVGLILWLSDRRKQKKAGNEIIPPAPAEPEEGESGECCGLHIVCEKDSLSPFTTDIEYYDDEELDRLRDRDPSSYSDEDIEELRDVLLTLRPEDIAGWARSLQLRRIDLPQEIRDELLLMVTEARKRPEK